MAHNPVTSPSHYTQYPVEPISICRHLGFCLGNVVKYVLRAPYKNGVEDLQKAMQYLAWEKETPAEALRIHDWYMVEQYLEWLGLWLTEQSYEPGNEMMGLQAEFLSGLDSYLRVGQKNQWQMLHDAVKAMLAKMEA